MKSDKIGLAIAGLGFGEAVHIPAIKTNEIFNPLALWHHREERLMESSAQNNIKPQQNWNNLLKDKEIQAIIIATPPEPRFQLAVEAIKAGKHLLLEKPAALNSDQIHELKLIASSHNVCVAVNFEYRAVPVFMQAKRLINKGFIGEPWLIKLDWLMSSRADPSREWNWYSLSEKGGGVIGALGTHAFDILHWLCGPIVSISSITSTSIKHRPNVNTNKLEKVTSEDVALAQLEILNINKNSIIPAQVSLSSVSREGRGFSLEIHGSQGSLNISSTNQKDYVHGFNLFASSSEKRLNSINIDSDLIFPKTWSDGRIAPVARLQRWWGKSVQYGSPMIPGLLEGLQSQKVCDSLKKSSQTGQKILISL